MTSCYQPTNRFCYNYKAQGFIQPCCPPIVSATNQYVSSIACTTSVIFGQSKTNQGVFLLNKQQDVNQAAQSTIIGNTVQSTINNANTITAQIQSQVIQIGQDKYIPYQPYIPPVIPSSVIQLQMATANVGVPMSFFTMSNCRGNQTVSSQQNSISPPTNVVAVPYYGSALITFTPSTGAYYKVISNPGNILTIGSSSPILVSGLTNGLYYTFTVTANNTSSSSVPITSNIIIVGTTPSAPTNIVVIPSSNSASV